MITNAYFGMDAGRNAEILASIPEIPKQNISQNDID